MRCADITFVILTRNEAENIEACLRSLPAESSAIVYDALSEDGTAAIARRLGATVVEAPWHGFVRSRIAAANLVTTAWTFMLDADERLSLALREELTALDPAEEVYAFSVPRRNWFCGRPLRCAGWWPDRLVRLFRTGQAEMRARGAGDDTVHETWIAAGKVGLLLSPLEHLSYPTIQRYRTKFRRYTELEARAKPRSVMETLVSVAVAPLRFGWLWIGRRGALEGWRGAYVCAASAAYPVVVAAKRWRRHRPDDDHRA